MVLCQSLFPPFHSSALSVCSTSVHCLHKCVCNCLKVLSISSNVNSYFINVWVFYIYRDTPVPNLDKSLQVLPNCSLISDSENILSTGDIANKRSYIRHREPSRDSTSPYKCTE